MKIIETLLITLILGLFLVVGVILQNKNKKKLKNISIPLVIGCFITLIFFELLPNSLKIITRTKPSPFNYLVVIGFSLLGIVIIKIIDRFSFNHNYFSKRKNVYNDNLVHTLNVTLIPIILYNIVEEIILYQKLYFNIHGCIIMLIGFCLVNIIFGYFIGESFGVKYSFKQVYIKTFLISLSSFIGGLLVVILKKYIANYEVGVLLCITMGMSIYCILFELLHLIDKKEKKKNFICIILGFVIVFIGHIF